MWDLIVSVPDHCLSFYFREGRSGYSKHTYFFSPKYKNYVSSEKEEIKLIKWIIICLSYSEGV